MSSSRNDNDAVERVDDRKVPSRQARNIGILSVAAYFPKTYVSQEDLEVYDKVDAGKYTKGLMQDKMGFCTDLEDINSIALTVIKRLIDQSGVSLSDIGYLEVGTETILDKSKSVKTVLMDLFEASGNTDIEGVDTTNACYGGTAALFHAIDYCSAPYWDGRLAIVIAADIAVYDKGNARPTGGCGAVAMLVGPNAPLVFDPFRATYMSHTYDFYKPDPASEYPMVDGKLSLQAYVVAIDKCYQVYRRKYFQFNSAENAASKSLIDDFDGILMHSPFCKLVRKGFARLLFDEFEAVAKTSENPQIKEQDRYKGFFDQAPEEDLNIAYENWLKPINKTSLEKIAIQLSEKLYQEKTSDSLFLSNQVGNMYTASLYSCLVAYLTSKPVDQLVDKRILFFSYGSGLAASMFSARISSNVQAIRKLLIGIQDVRVKLQDRIKISPEEFTAHLEHRKMTFSLPNRNPTGTYYLTSIDGMYRRKYSRYEKLIENNNNEANCVLSKNHTHLTQQVGDELVSKEPVTNI